MITMTDFCDYNKQKYWRLNDYNETIITERRALASSTEVSPESMGCLFKV